MESPILQRAKPTVSLTILALIGLAITLLAAHWQFNRAAYKEELLREYREKQSDERINLNEETIRSQVDLRYKKVVVVGQFLSEKTLFLDNKVNHGVAGYQTVVPLRFASTHLHKKRDHVILVNRGWTAWGKDRNPVNKPSDYRDTVKVEGIIDFEDKNILKLGKTDVKASLRPYLNIKEAEDYLGIKLENIIIFEEPPKSIFYSSFKTPDFGISTHRMYMGQWLIFAALILVLYFYYGFRSIEKID